MATKKVRLKTGLQVGEERHFEAEIREATVADMLDATEESEKVVRTAEGYQLVTSPLLVGVNTLRRQIVRIGTYDGPLSMAEIRKLPPYDLDTLQAAADTLEQATMQEVMARGRGDGGEGSS